MSKELQWLFPGLHPQNFQQGSDGNQKAFDGTIDSLLREAIQNASDARWPIDSENKVKIRVTAIKLSGNSKTKFLKTMGWEQLSRHVEAVADNKNGGADVLNQSLKDGLSKLKSKPLYLLRVEDFNTSGLFGYEEENEQDPVPNVYRGALFAAGHSINKLAGSGGSFGMGKYALMKGSLIQTVLYNSNINKEPGSFNYASEKINLEKFTGGNFKNRLLGRTVLGTHKLDDKSFGKEGWFGIPNIVEQKLDDSDHTNRFTVAESCWAEENIVEDLYLNRDDYGTSVLIVGYDPEKDFDNYDINLQDLISEMKTKIANNFWPALSKKESLHGGLEIEVGGIENGNVVEAFESINPKNFLAGYVTLYKEYEDQLSNPIADLDQSKELRSPKDTVSKVINFNIPETKKEVPERYLHGKTDHDVALLVKYIDPATDTSVDPEFLNKVALIRGPGMVVKYEFGEKDSSTGRGKPKRYNKNFIAIAIAGGFSQDPNFEEDAKIADKFLTHCEPPHHDQWTNSTDAFKALYPKNQGAKKRFNENMDSIKDAISELLREDFEVTSDIPREMQKLLTFPGEGSAGETGDKETRNFSIRLIQQEIEFSERNSTYKIPVEMTAPQSLEKTVSVKVGILGDSIKSSDKLEIPFTIVSLKGKSASLEKNNVIKVDHTKFSSRKTSRKINFSFIVNVASVGVDPFNLGLSLENPQVLEVH